MGTVFAVINKHLDAIVIVQFMKKSIDVIPYGKFFRVGIIG